MNDTNETDDSVRSSEREEYDPLITFDESLKNYEHEFNKKKNKKGKIINKFIHDKLKNRNTHRNNTDTYSPLTPDVTKAPEHKIKELVKKFETELQQQKQPTTITQGSQNLHDFLYINTVTRVASHNELNIIAKCYGKTINKTEIVQTVKKLLKAAYRDTNDTCIKLIHNRCRCGEEIELTRIMDHYASIKHTLNKKKYKYLEYDETKNSYKCTQCEDVFFKTDQYGKVFEHMFSVHGTITFPVLNFIENEFKKSNKKLSEKHTLEELIEQKLTTDFIEHKINKYFEKRTSKREDNETLKDNDRSIGVEVHLNLDDTERNEDVQEQKKKRIKDLTTDERDRLKKLRRAKKTEYQREARKRQREQAARTGLQAPIPRKQNKHAEETLWASFQKNVADKMNNKKIKHSIDDLYCYECFKLNKYKKIKRMNISEHYMRNHDIFKLTFEGKEMAKNDKDTLTALVLDSNKYVYPNNISITTNNRIDEN